MTAFLATPWQVALHHALIATGIVMMALALADWRDELMGHGAYELNLDHVEPAK